MNRFYLFFLSLLLGLFLYTLPAYSIPGLCDSGSDLCFEMSANPLCCPPGEACESIPQEPGVVLCLGNSAGQPVLDGGGCCLPDDAVEGDSCGCDVEVVADHLMCYQMKDELNKAPDVDIVVPQSQFEVDMNCEDTGSTRMFCAPACKDQAEFAVCEIDESKTDFICYRFDQCEFAEGSDFPPDQKEEIEVKDQFSQRFISDFDEHMLCLPAEKLPPPPPPPPGPTPDCTGNPQ